MDADSFIVHRKTDDIHRDIAQDLETRFDYDLARPLSKGKNKKVIGLIKGELRGRIMKKFVGLEPKTIVT